METVGDGSPGPERAAARCPRGREAASPSQGLLAATTNAAAPPHRAARRPLLAPVGATRFRNQEANAGRRASVLGPVGNL